MFPGLNTSSADKALRQGLPDNNVHDYIIFDISSFPLTVWKWSSKTMT